MPDAKNTEKLQLQIAMKMRETGNLNHTRILA